ncbi:MAG: 1-acyl-sn-glycerol-3-phosphate acyltransferase [Oscillospiraceae bacterium]|jgi:1-acyl-sn-glycerol-3-phosphate acyltransferase|nr:1-acyl-sn-glycerol-3-phosphate acyltransferase [Oscillospiraceae bacterium]
MKKEPKQKQYPYERYPFGRIKPYFMYTVLRPLGWLIFFCFAFRFKVVGRQSLPKDAAGHILVCNHLHSIDPIFLVVASKRNWRFMAKKELFRHPLSAFFIRHFNGFPVDRDVIDRKALEYSIAVLKDGRAGLGIFPEGKRSVDGVPQTAKNGVSMLARKTRASIVPASIYHEGPLKFRRRITIRFGEVIPFEELGLGESPNARETRQASEKIMNAVTALWEQGY